MSFDLRHALAVATKFANTSEDEWVAALLHDALEDTDLTREELEAAGVDPHASTIIQILTRQKSETYTAYIERVSRHPQARRVKIADLEANLARMDEAHDSLKPRYENALRLLVGIEALERIA